MRCEIHKLPAIVVVYLDWGGRSLWRCNECTHSIAELLMHVLRCRAAVRLVHYR